MFFIVLLIYLYKRVFNNFLKSNFKIHKKHVNILLFSSKFISFIKQYFKFLTFFIIIFPQYLTLSTHLLIHFEDMIFSIFIIVKFFKL